MKVCLQLQQCTRDNPQLISKYQPAQEGDCSRQQEDQQGTTWKTSKQCEVQSSGSSRKAISRHNLEKAFPGHTKFSIYKAMMPNLPRSPSAMYTGTCTYSHNLSGLHPLPWTAGALTGVQNHENRAMLAKQRLVFKWRTVICFPGVVQGPTVVPLHCYNGKNCSGQEMQLPLFGFGLPLCYHYKVSVHGLQLRSICRKRAIPCHL